VGRETVRKSFLRADRIALAATKVVFARWRRDRMVSLTEQFTDLFHEKTDEVEIALRQIERCPHLYSEEDKNYWQRRHQEINRELFFLAYEIGLPLFADSFEPMLVRRFRQAIAKKIIR